MTLWVTLLSNHLINTLSVLDFIVLSPDLHQKVSQKYQEQFIDELGSPEQTQTPKRSMQKVEAGTDDLGGV